MLKKIMACMLHCVFYWSVLGYGFEIDIENQSNSPYWVDASTLRLIRFVETDSLQNQPVVCKSVRILINPTKKKSFTLFFETDGKGGVDKEYGYIGLIAFNKIAAKLMFVAPNGYSEYVVPSLDRNWKATELINPKRGAAIWKGLDYRNKRYIFTIKDLLLQTS